MNRILFPQRTIVRGCDQHYKVYLPREYNEILKRIHNEGRSISVVVILPREITGCHEEADAGKKALTGARQLQTPIKLVHMVSTHQDRRG